MTTTKSLSFDEAFKQLKSIVEKLGDGSIGLDEAVIEYEQGLTLLKICRKKLNHAELKLKTLNIPNESDTDGIEKHSNKDKFLNESLDSKSYDNSSVDSMDLLKKDL